MKIVYDDGFKRIIRWANPQFNNVEKRLRLEISEIVMVKKDDQWIELEEARKACVKIVEVSNEIRVGPDGLIDNNTGPIGFYDWMLSITAEVAGISQPSDIVFEKVGDMIEKFLVDNGLISVPAPAAEGVEEEGLFV